MVFAREAAVHPDLDADSLLAPLVWVRQELRALFEMCWQTVWSARVGASPSHFREEERGS
jgi:hypothetical protein